jgi:hypothetical protein
MKKKLFTTFALVCGGLMVCLAVMADLTGKWTGAVKTPNGDFPVSYTFKVEGEKLTGTADSEQGSMPITDGKVNGTNFSFGLDFNGVALKTTGKYLGDSITIDVDYQGTPLHGVLKRVAEKK